MIRNKYKRHIIKVGLLFLFTLPVIFFFLTRTTITRLESTATSIQVTDYNGTIITLKKPTQRIIALAPHIVENVFSVGLGDRLVGVVSHSDFPEEAKAIEVVGHYNGYSLEKIIALQPDIVLIWASSNKNNIAEKIRALNIPVYIDEPHSLQDISKSLNDIATLGGISSNKIVKIQEFNQRIYNLKLAQRTNNSKNKPKVFFQISTSPLQTLNGMHIVSDIINLCGGINIYADEKVIAPLISMESLLAHNPDMIITGSDTAMSASLNNTKNQTDERNTSLNYWEKYSELSAVKHQGLIYIPADWLYRHTLRIADAAELMCAEMAQRNSANH